MKEIIWLRTKKLTAVLIQNPEIFFVRVFYKCFFWFLGFVNRVRILS